jgi:hypothetical protein
MQYIAQLASKGEEDLFNHMEGSKVSQNESSFQHQMKHLELSGHATLQHYRSSINFMVELPVIYSVMRGNNTTRPAVTKIITVERLARMDVQSTLDVADCVRYHQRCWFFCIVHCS